MIIQSLFPNNLLYHFVFKQLDRKVLNCWVMWHVKQLFSLLKPKPCSIRPKNQKRSICLYYSKKIPPWCFQVITTGRWRLRKQSMHSVCSHIPLPSTNGQNTLCTWVTAIFYQTIGILSVLVLYEPCAVLPRQRLDSSGQWCRCCGCFYFSSLWFQLWSFTSRCRCRWVWKDGGSHNCCPLVLSVPIKFRGKSNRSRYCCIFFWGGEKPDAKAHPPRYPLFFLDPSLLVLRSRHGTA